MRWPFVQCAQTRSDAGNLSILDWQPGFAKRPMSGQTVLCGRAGWVTPNLRLGQALSLGGEQMGQVIDGQAGLIQEQTFHLGAHVLRQVVAGPALFH
jgi:hypothetical protein